jgi:hypothetical protein
MSNPQMLHHASQITWTFNIPPDNMRRVVILKRVDGVFRKDLESVMGCYHVCEEQMLDGLWTYIRWSTKGSFSNAADAWAAAEKVWLERVHALEVRHG